MLLYLLHLGEARRVCDSFPRNALKSPRVLKYTCNHMEVMMVKLNKLNLSWETACVSSESQPSTLAPSRVLAHSSGSVNICGMPVCSQKSLSTTDPNLTLCMESREEFAVSGSVIFGGRGGGKGPPYTGNQHCLRYYQ